MAVMLVAIRATRPPKKRGKFKVMHATPVVVLGEVEGSGEWG